MNPTSVGHAIRELDNFIKSLTDGCEELSQKLAEKGASEAQMNFNDSEYTGVMDVSVTHEKSADGYDVVATGGNVMFIEFGTGITNPDIHPEQGVDGLVGHGEYGYGRGANKTGWIYRGETGNAPRTVRIRDTEKVHTYGNIANMCMYRAKKALEDDYVEDMAREVFKR